MILILEKLISCDECFFCGPCNLNDVTANVILYLVINVIECNTNKWNVQHPPQLQNRSSNKFGVHQLDSNTWSLRLNRKSFAAYVHMSRTDLHHHHSCQEFHSIAADAAARRLPLKVA